MIYSEFINVKCKYYTIRGYFPFGLFFECGRLFKQKWDKCNNFKVDWITFISQRQHLVLLENNNE